MTINLSPRAIWLLADLLSEHLEFTEPHDVNFTVPRRDQIVLAIQLHETLSSDGGYPSPWTQKEAKGLRKEIEAKKEANLTVRNKKRR